MEKRIDLPGDCWWKARNDDSIYGDIVTDMGFHVLVPGVFRSDATALAAAMRAEPAAPVTDMPDARSVIGNAIAMLEDGHTDLALLTLKGARGDDLPSTPPGDVAMQAARDLHNNGMLYGYDPDEAQEKAAAIIQGTIQATNPNL